MKTAKQLREEKAPLVDELRQLAALATTEKRELTEDEETRSNEITTSLEELDEKIEAAEKREKHLKVVAGNAIDDGLKKEEEKVKRTYSLTKALRAQLPGQPALEGLELEMHQEAQKEIATRGKDLEGVGIPEMLLKRPEERAYSAGSADNGSKLIETSLVGFIDALRPKLMVEQLGATVMNGLTGDVKIPALDSHSTGTWEGEVDDAAEATATIGERSLSPNRVSAYSELSKQLLFQSSPDVDRMITSDLGRALKIAEDAAALNGTGSGQPEGILNNSGISVVALGTNGDAPTFAKMVEMETAIAALNADINTMNYLVTPGLRGLLKTLTKDSGSGQFVWNGNMVNGYNAFATTQLPSDLTKGTGTDLHAAIFGDWSSLIIGRWAGLDIVVDPYTLAKKSKVVITVNEWCDIALRHAASFAAIKDAVVA